MQHRNAETNCLFFLRKIEKAPETTTQDGAKNIICYLYSTYTLIERGNNSEIIV